jgi:RNA polymerase sigma factor (sigma-70 family)
MPRDRYATFLGQLRRAALRREGGPSDGELLERYVRAGDAAAFEALVRQHGAMVLGVCRRVLRNWHDAEDAFQATFLVLARKAPSVRPRHRVGNFLYGVAYRTALEARRAAARRRLKEAAAPPRADLPADGPWEELRPVLDRELAGLPEKYRAPIVLCDLEGKTRREAAHQLGWREGTLSGRLARARVLLARRLTRYGVGVAGGALAALLGREAAARVPGPLFVSTVKAAAGAAAGEAAALPAHLAALVEGVNRAMWMSKAKVVALGLLLAGAVGGVGVLTYPGRGTAQAPAVPATGRVGPGPVPLAPDPLPHQVIRPGDVLNAEITWRGERPLDLARAFRVQPDGSIHLDELGTVSVAGKTVTEVWNILGRRLKERAPNSGLTDEQFRHLMGMNLALIRDGKPPVVETQKKVYHVHLTVVQLAADGKDLGDLVKGRVLSAAQCARLGGQLFALQEAGKGKVVAGPRLASPEGTPCSFRDGGEMAVPGGGSDGKVAFLETGLSVRATVRGLPDGRLRLDAVLERAESDQADESGVQVRARSVRVIERLKLGEAVKLVERDDRGEPRYLAVVRVVKEEEVFTRTREAQAEPAPSTPARVGKIILVGNKKTEPSVILRQVHLTPGQVLTYPAVREAERNLERLGLFRVDPDKGVRPTVTVVDPGDGSEVKDILIRVEEKPAAGRPPQK